MKNAAIFLDRDGTLMVDKHYLNDAKKIEYLPGVFEALKTLQTIGFRLIVVTNQSGVARGIISLEQLQAIHDKMTHDFAQAGVHFDAIYFSPHAADSHHPTRKPNPGMLLEGQRQFAIDMKKSWMIGDSPADIEAGQRAGTRTILLRPTTEGFPSHIEPTVHMGSWAEIVKYIESHL